VKGFRVTFIHEEYFVPSIGPPYTYEQKVIVHQNFHQHISQSISREGFRGSFHLLPCRCMNCHIIRTGFGIRAECNIYGVIVHVWAYVPWILSHDFS
jgi:hypothetical protein